MPKLIFSFFLCLLFAAPALAASSEEPAFRVTSLQSSDPASSGFLLSFAADENQCRQRYGKKWREKCAVAIGMPGREEKNIALAPALSGTWRWLDGNMLEFLPDKPNAIQPGVRYTADLSRLFVPSFVKLNSRTPVLKTAPRGARLLSSEFWIDPSEEEWHRLAASFAFNYPVPADFQYPQLKLARGIRAGKPEVVWNAEKNHLNISWLIQNLPEASSEAKMLFPGFGQLTESKQDGRIIYTAPVGKNNAAIFYKNLPGRNRLFQVKKAEIKKQADRNLDREFVLQLETSLYAEPAKVAENLQIWELPLYNSSGASEPYNWSMAPAISAEVLAKSKKISARSLEEGRNPRSKFSFSLPVSKGRYLLVMIEPELRSAANQKLDKTGFFVLRAPLSAPDLAFLQPGNILPLKGDGKIGVYSTDLQKIVWKLEKIRQPFFSILAQAADRPFSEYLAPAHLDLESFSLAREGEIKLPEPVEGKAQFSSLNMEELYDSFDGQAGPARLTLTGHIDGKEVARVSRLILPTNLALVVKKAANGDMRCFVAESDAGKPAPGVEVSILGANGLAARKAASDENGHVTFASLEGLRREQRPVAIVASRGEDLAWMPLTDPSRQLDYAAFSVTGNHVSGNDVNLYAYGQRGVYRPGETLFFGVIARKGDFAPLPADLPLYAEMINPAGVKLWDKSFTASENGFSELAWQSPPTAISGKYILNIKSGRDGDILASVMSRLENFLPETLRLKISAPVVKGWIQIGDQATILDASLQNLFGTPASGNRLQASLQTRPAKFRFPGYEAWVFTDAAPFMGNGTTLRLPELTTDQNGHARLELPLRQFANSSARVFVLGEGFEKGGGRPATAQAELLISPMDKILGYKLLDSLTNPDFVPQGGPASLEFLALDPQLNAAPWRELEFSILRKKYVTSLISDGNGGYRYDDIPLNLTVSSEKIDLPANGLKYSLKTDKPGEYLLAVRDSSGKTVASFSYKVAGREVRSGEGPLAGGKMRLHLDKKTYAPGDEIRCSLSLPYDGYGLMAIEREGVENFSWFRAKAGESIQSIKIPDNFEGRGYLTITFGRDLNSPLIYMEPLSFAAMPFDAELESRNMDLKIAAPRQSLPGKNLDIQVSANAPGKFILAAVDEGILMLDNYINPDPLGQLLGNRALDVRTLQTFDLLMPDQALISSRLSPFGGGMSGAPFGMRFQNPFKRRSEPPVVFWSGLLELDADPVNVQIPIPEYYSGNLKIMAVGVGGETCGAAFAQSAIAAPLVMKPQFPLALAPGDEFEGVLLLENTTRQPLSGQLKITAPPALASASHLPDSFELAPMEQKILPMRFTAQDMPGECGLTFDATSPAGNFTRKISISVRPASPYRMTMKGGIIKSDGDLTAPRSLYSYEAETILALDATPFPLTQAFGFYLETYPYGCTEQLISRAFGQLLLPPDQRSPNAEKLLGGVFAALRERSSYGGISLWTGGEPDLLLTAYGADFLVTLREKGNYGNSDLLEMICDALESNCQLNESSLEAARTSAYAIWVLTRSGRITTRHLENLESAMAERGIGDWREDLTGVLIAASKKEMRIKMPAPAKPRFSSSDGWLDEYSQHAMFMALMARYFPDELTGEQKQEFFEATIVKLNANAYATFSVAQGLRALNNFSDAASVDISLLKTQCLEPSSSQLEWLDARTAKTALCRRYHVSGVDPSAPLFWQITQKGYDADDLAASEAHGVSIAKKFTDANGNPLKQWRQGDEIHIAVTVSSEDGRPHECVINDLLSGGVEMIFPTGDADAELLAKAHYLDRQEDRMLIFARVEREPKTFVWKARAVNNGHFVAPPAYVEDMLNRGKYGSSSADRIVITAEKTTDSRD